MTKLKKYLNTYKTNKYIISRLGLNFAHPKIQLFPGRLSGFIGWQKIFAHSFLGRLDYFMKMLFINFSYRLT